MADGFYSNKGLWLWVPAFAGTTPMSLRAKRSNPSLIWRCRAVDCFASLAMTRWRFGSWLFEIQIENPPPPSSRTSEARSGTHTPRLLVGVRTTDIFQNTSVVMGSCFRRNDTDVIACDKREAFVQGSNASYSITSSARPSSSSGIERPSAFAVLRLMIISTFVAR